MQNLWAYERILEFLFIWRLNLNLICTKCKHINLKIIFFAFFPHIFSSDSFELKNKDKKKFLVNFYRNQHKTSSQNIFYLLVKHI
jgi:hypothetical protein